MRKSFLNQSGFTLIEAVAVLGVLAVTTAILLMNNRLSEQQLSLSKDAAAIANAVSRAKSLTLQNLDESGCGYGAHFTPATNINQGSYIIFKDTNCNRKYDANENIAGQESVSKLDSGLTFVSSNSAFLIKDVVFYSSDAKVKLTRFDGNNISPAGIVIIKTESTPASYMTLKITIYGQITSKPGFYSAPEAFDSDIEDLPNGEITVQNRTEQGPGGEDEGNPITDENPPPPCISDSCVGKTCADYNGCGKPCIDCSSSGQFCINKQCADIIGCPPQQENPHSECNGAVCQSVSGCGPTICTVGNNDVCGGPPPPPPPGGCSVGEENPHSECIGAVCESVSGCGPTICTVGNNDVCGGPPPPPPPPDCTGKVCGEDNGYGGVCTYCPTGQTCSLQTYTCISNTVELRVDSISPSFITN